MHFIFLYPAYLLLRVVSSLWDGSDLTPNGLSWSLVLQPGAAAPGSQLLSAAYPKGHQMELIAFALVSFRGQGCLA